MGYNTILFDPDASKNLHHYVSMRELFFPRVTNGYIRFSRHLPSKDVRAYGSLNVHKNLLDDLLCITKASLDDHSDHLRLVLTRLQEVGLKVNNPKIEILCCRNGIPRVYPHKD